MQYAVVLTLVLFGCAERRGIGLTCVATDDCRAGLTCQQTVCQTDGGGGVSVALAITPMTADILINASQQFTSRTSATWSVTETGGGTMTAMGLYTAPAIAGTYHVVATLADESATATVTVRAPPVVGPAPITPDPIAPALSTLSLLEVFAGDAVTVTGTGFGATQGPSAITVGGG